MNNLNLKNYYGKNVTIICYDGNIYTGIVDDYFYPQDNETGEESILLKYKNSEIVEFTSSDIEEIITN